MTTFYTVVSWLVILGYWVLIAGVTLRILMKRRAVPSAMARLLIIYLDSTSVLQKHNQSLDKYAFLRNSAFTHWVKEKCSKIC